jgi:hypothetical protein
VPVALLKKIVIQLIKTGLAKGWIEADRFIPDVYMQERHAELERELRMDGILGLSHSYFHLVSVVVEVV